MSYLAIEAMLSFLGVVITVANLVLLHRSIRTYQANRATLAAIHEVWVRMELRHMAAHPPTVSMSWESEEADG